MTEKKHSESSTDVIDVSKLLKTQLNHFFSKNSFWYCFTIFELYCLLMFIPEHAKDMWPKIMDCLTPDVQNGVI